MEEMEKNEFAEEIKQQGEGVGQDFPEVPQNTGHEIPPMENTQEQTPSSRKPYDFSDEEDIVKLPERLDIDGQVVTIEKAEVYPPAPNKEWTNSRRNDKIKNKPCIFRIYMKTEKGESQIENYSGVQITKFADGNISKPGIWVDGKSQSAKLLKLYAEHVGKDKKEVNLAMLVKFLNSGIKAKIKAEEVEHYTTGKNFNKNTIGEFIN